MKESLFEGGIRILPKKFISSLRFKDILSAFLLSSFLAVSAYLLMPTKYSSKVTIVPSEDLSQIAQTPSISSSFNALIGINSNTSSNSIKFIQTIEVINTYGFFKKFVTKHDMVEAINSEALIGKQHSLQDTFSIFHKSVFNINFDNRKNLLTLTATHSSPEFAKNLLDKIVEEINLSVKNEDIVKSQSSIKFLNDQINQTELSEIKEALSFLIQKQIEKIMIAESSPEYVFKTIDPSIVPEKNTKSKYFVALLFMQILIFLICIFYSVSSRNPE